MPVLRLTLPFLQTLLNMSIVRAACSSPAYFLWEVSLGLLIFPNPYELTLPYPIASWESRLKHSSCVLLPESPSFHHGVYSTEQWPFQLCSVDTPKMTTG